jgi:hypothetical protein
VTCVGEVSARPFQAPPHAATSQEESDVAQLPVANDVRDLREAVRGVNMLTKSLAAELAPDGIRVNAIARGLSGPRPPSRWSTGSARRKEPPLSPGSPLVKCSTGSANPMNRILGRLFGVGSGQLPDRRSHQRLGRLGVALIATPRLDPVVGTIRRCPDCCRARPIGLHQHRAP